jgi:hypothetical protein
LYHPFLQGKEPEGLPRGQKRVNSGPTLEPSPKVTKRGPGRPRKTAREDPPDPTGVASTALVAAPSAPGLGEVDNDGAKTLGEPRGQESLLRSSRSMVRLVTGW